MRNVVIISTKNIMFLHQHYCSKLIKSRKRNFFTAPSLPNGVLLLKIALQLKHPLLEEGNVVNLLFRSPTLTSYSICAFNFCFDHFDFAIFCYFICSRFFVTFIFPFHIISVVFDYYGYNRRRSIVIRMFLNY